MMSQIYKLHIHISLRVRNILLTQKLVIHMHRKKSTNVFLIPPTQKPQKNEINKIHYSYRCVDPLYTAYRILVSLSTSSKYLSPSTHAFKFSYYTPNARGSMAHVLVPPYFLSSSPKIYFVAKKKLHFSVSHATDKKIKCILNFLSVTPRNAECNPHMWIEMWQTKKQNTRDMCGW